MPQQEKARFFPADKGKPAQGFQKGRDTDVDPINPYNQQEKDKHQGKAGVQALINSRDGPDPHQQAKQGKKKHQKTKDGVPKDGFFPPDTRVHQVVDACFFQPPAAFAQS